jgi:hypothetical protein
MSTNYIVFNLYTEDSCEVYFVPENTIDFTLSRVMTSKLYDSLSNLDTKYLIKTGVKISGEIVGVYSFDVANC